MRDATYYPDTSRPPAERALLRENWFAPVPLEDALTAGVAPRSAAVYAVANHGRWIVQCPDCFGAQLAAPEDRRFMCTDCGNQAIGVLWRPVIWPAAPEEISALLDSRPTDLANWSPAETVDDLRRENELLVAGAVLLDPAPHDAEYEWAGHTHSWGPVDDASGVATCQECPEKIDQAGLDRVAAEAAEAAQAGEA